MYLEKSSFCSWHKEDLSCSIFPSLGQYTSRKRWRRARERNLVRMQQEQSWPGKQGVQKHGQEAVGAQSGTEKTERVRVCPFSYVTRKVVGRNNLFSLFTASRWRRRDLNPQERSFGHWGKLSNCEESETLEETAWEGSRGLCHLSWELSRVG